MRTPDYPHHDVPKWAAVDDYFASLFARPEGIPFAQVLANNHAAGLPLHDVSPVQGKLLALFVQLTRAKRVLEIGTLGGYSTLWMASALAPGGKVVTLEKNDVYAAVARKNFALAGLADAIDLRVGAAAEILPDLDAPFDLVFIDADKPNNPLYLQWALRLSRVGTVIIGDNVVRGGAVVDETSTDANVKGVRTFLHEIAAEPALSTTAIQTVGEKGWDGFSISVVTAPPRS